MATPDTNPGKTDDKHSKILNAAVGVFSRNGFYNSKISEIAKIAGVADGTIYLYFKNKDDILIRIFETAMDTIHASLDRSWAGVDDPIEKLRRLIFNHFELVENNPEMAEVLQVELRQSHLFMKEYRPERWLSYLKRIQDLVIDGQERRVFRRDLHAGIIKRAVFGAMDELALHWVLNRTRNKYSLKDTAKGLADLFIGGLLAQPGGN